MATYNGIHIQNINTEAIKGALQTFRRREWWRWGQDGAVPPWLCTVMRFLPWTGPDYEVHPPEGGWSELAMSRWADGTRKLAEHLSATLNCRVMVLGYQTTAGSQYIRVCEQGKTVRLLSFASGEDEPYEEEGEPFPFELEFTARRRRDVESELAAMSEEDRAEEQDMLRHTSLLPGCEEFAAAFGCDSFHGRHGL